MNSLPAVPGAADRERGQCGGADEPGLSSEVSIAGLAQELLRWDLVVGLDVGLSKTAARFCDGLARL